MSHCKKTDPCHYYRLARLAFPYHSESYAPSSTVVSRDLRDFTIVNGKLHDLSCGNNGISLYRRLVKQGYHWPKMAKEVAKLQPACPVAKNPWIWGN